MSQRPFNSNTQPMGQQQGAALIVALLILLVLTLLGVTAMQTTTLQERMAGSSSDHQVAFQSAEAALRAGERAVINGNQGDSASPPHLRHDHNGDRAAWVTAWETLLKENGSAHEPTPPATSPPLFYIHQLGPVPGSQDAGDSDQVEDEAFGPVDGGGGSGSAVYQYAVTALGYGRSMNTVVILQSIIEH